MVNAARNAAGVDAEQARVGERIAGVALDQSVRDSERPPARERKCGARQAKSAHDLLGRRTGRAAQWPACAGERVVYAVVNRAGGQQSS
jgi:hypothetical protein